MASLIINGDTSGTSTLQAPSIAGSAVLTLPTTSGTLGLAGPNVSGIINYTTSASATSEDLGKLTYFTGTGGTLTLPDVSSCPQNSVLSYTNAGQGKWTIARSGTPAIYALGQVGVTSIPLFAGESVQLTNDGANWIQVCGSTGGLGYGQTWTSFAIGAAGRQASTTYTNTSGKPIVLSIFSTFAYSSAMSIQINTVEIAYKIESYVNSLKNNVSIIIPNGGTYSYTGPTPTFWYELR